MSTGTIGRVFGYLLLAILVSILAIMAWASHLNRDLKRWDAMTDALCAANGGRDVATRVYETVMAPETDAYFRETKPVRSLGIPIRSEGQMLGPRYPYVSETRVVEILNSSDPSVVKYTERIVRTSDNKILSERFGYQRSGGGVPWIDPQEIRTCPSLRNEDRLDVRTFVNHPHYKAMELQ